MKVLWFTNVPVSLNHNLKGTGTWLNTLTNKVSGKSDLYICYFDQLEAESISGSIKTLTLKKGLFGKFLNFIPFNYFNRRNVSRYLNIINKIKPDIIHIHGTENTFIEILKFENKLPPIIISIQGNISVYKKMYFRGISFFSCILSGNIMPLLNYLWFAKISRLEIQYLKNLKYVIGRTEWDHRVSRVLAPNSKYFKVGEILRTDFYKNKWINTLRPNKIILFTTSANIIYKGFEVICESLTLLQGMGLDVEWKVAGISEKDSIVRTTKYLLGNKYPHSKLQLLGSLSSNLLVEEMLQSDLYIGVSHIENSPNSLCEAMLMGMPCIVSSVGGVNSLIENKIDGILVQDGDAFALTGAIIDLINNYDSFAISLGQNARKRALIRHNEEQILSDLILAYKTIAN
jgi:glycosyltransferase involved in cell wall biosynthesis